MATETLGANLRNLLSPYKNLIAIAKNTNLPKFIVDDCERNLNELIEFSRSDKMEGCIWRSEEE